jgi:glucosamine-6-phosphate deaminase
MEVIIKPHADAVSKEAARIFRHQINGKLESVLGLATGSTPLGLYRELIAMFERGEVDFSGVTTFNLDEYVGLGPEHPQSYFRFMWENLFSRINVPRENIHLPNGLADDIPAHCDEYENAIAKSGYIDLQLLGLGTDGHIGFNEPSSSLTSRTRLKTLTPQTIADNARFFGSEAAVPRHAITMGIGSIQNSERILVLALGAQKAAAVSAMVEGPVTANVPASVLQFHPHCQLIVDEPAATALKRRDYYRWVYDHKPDWQRV